MTPAQNDKRVNGGVHRQYYQEGSFRDGADESDFMSVFAGNLNSIEKSPEAQLMFAVLSTALLDLSYDRDEREYNRTSRSKSVQEMRRRAQNSREGKGVPKQSKIDKSQEQYMDDDYYDPEVYIFGEDQDSAYSFENCCETLGINAATIRRIVRNPKWRMAKNYQSFLRLDRFAGVNPRMTIGICYDGRIEGSGGMGKGRQFRRR